MSVLGKSDQALVKSAVVGRPCYLREARLRYSISEKKIPQIGTRANHSVSPEQASQLDFEHCRDERYAERVHFRHSTQSISGCTGRFAGRCDGTAMVFKTGVVICLTLSSLRTTSEVQMAA